MVRQRSVGTLIDFSPTTTTYGFSMTILLFRRVSIVTGIYKDTVRVTMHANRENRNGLCNIFTRRRQKRNGRLGEFRVGSYVRAAKTASQMCETIIIIIIIVHNRGGDRLFTCAVYSELLQFFRGYFKVFLFFLFFFLTCFTLTTFFHLEKKEKKTRTIIKYMSAKCQLFYTLVFHRPLFTGGSGLQLCTRKRASVTIGQNTNNLKFIVRVVRVENGN